MQTVFGGVSGGTDVVGENIRYRLEACRSCALRSCFCEEGICCVNKNVLYRNGGNLINSINDFKFYNLPILNLQLYF